MGKVLPGSSARRHGAVRREEALPSPEAPMDLIKSKQRVADHGEVFTPPWMVDAMLGLAAAAGSPCSLIRYCALR